MAQAGEVEAYLEELEHPLKAVIVEVRRVILEADSRISESIKWKSPTFEYLRWRSSARGNLASINPRAKQFVSLMFHTGALIPGEHPCQEGGGETARYMRFADAADVQRQRPALEGIVRAWCEWKDA
jgi:hypothetical protein